jgi:LmbE family N-acetylglucosaminyl deacetylase
MMELGWRRTRGDEPLKVLAIGAHADDIEIGCGGTILSWIAAGAPLDVTWVVFGALGPREEEARQSARFFLRGALRQRVVAHGFRDGYFPYDLTIKDEFERLKAEVDPDLVFTHHRDDRHQDHRAVSDLTWNTFRAHALLEYEIPKYDGDLRAPNIFVALSRDVCNKKVDALLTHFGSQADKQWFTRDTFLGLARLRGIECGSPSGFAEAFYGRKLQLGCSPCEPAPARTRGAVVSEGLSNAQD